MLNQSTILQRWHLKSIWVSTSEWHWTVRTPLKSYISSFSMPSVREKKQQQADILIINNKTTGGNTNNANYWIPPVYFCVARQAKVLLTPQMNIYLSNKMKANLKQLRLLGLLWVNRVLVFTCPFPQMKWYIVYHQTDAKEISRHAFLLNRNMPFHIHHHWSRQDVW